MKLQEGMSVVFVPSHDAEYNPQPDDGIVSAVARDGQGVTIKYYSEADSYQSARHVGVNPEYVADSLDLKDVVRLLRKINDLVLEYQRLLYLVEIDVPRDRLLEQIKNRTRYHIN